MANVVVDARPGSGVLVSLIFDDQKMLFVGMNYTNASLKTLRVSLLSPYAASFVLLGGSPNNSLTIPPGQRPSYTLGPKGDVRGIIWQATLGN